MKKCCSFLLLPMLLFSCTNDFDESNEMQQEQPNIVSNMTTSSVSINLNQIVTQLVTSYKAVYISNSNNTLSQKIMLLEKVAIENTNFTEIKPTNFTIPTEEEAKKFVANYDLEYNNLNVSNSVKTYFNSILELEYSSGLSNILYSITIDDQLNSSEKNLLIFTINSLNDNDNKGDHHWRKKKIVAATLGFEKSNANAVFNVALLNII